MKISELAEKLEFEIVTQSYNDNEVADGYTSDLLSDVMGNAKEESVLITIQAHKNSVAVASQLDFAGIIICNNRSIPSELIEAAESEKIAVLKTPLNQFTASYKVYQALNS
jgi:serine kinase of HPr protein (carbohydrate metabolism regulator)